ncbi:MAG TPA: bacillithiol biosynthesis cysteine-adding enzyme BshC [Vicinamibacterales bacterium]|nr:bacillithiol biosynthesis cysteine-adding enzyme BshC [Vicinamibacterales bacterium]
MALREYDSVSSESATSTVPDSGHLRAAGVDVRRFPWIRRLAGDYAYQFERIAPLYAGDPTTDVAWRSAVERAQAHPRDRAAIAAVLQAQQARRGAPPAARAAATRLSEATTVAVVTGQQAGAFGGPLFTLLKAITAIQLARRTEQKQGIAAVPIFWVDAEDHDWEEVRRCTVLDAEFQPRTVTLADLSGAGELPVAKLQLDSRIEQTIRELEAALPRTEFTADVVAGLEQAWHAGAGMASAFAQWIERLLGPYGLVVFESADPAAKPLAAGIFARELGSPGRTAALATDAGHALAERGHEPQVMPQPDSLALFSLDGGRRPIKRQGDGFVVGDRTYAADDLVRQAAARPEAFSPNVLLRPIVQDALFPTICYVAGPSELAYLGQLGGVYRQFGLPMPLMYPRATATLLDSASSRFLAKYNVPFEDLQPQDESALNRLLESQLPQAVEASLRDAAEQITRSMQRVIDALPALDATLTGAARTTVGRIEHDLRSLHSKVIHAAKRRDDTLRRQFTRLQAQAFPLGHSQERTLGVVYFLNRYGPGIVDRLIEELPLGLGQHWIVTV